jgi:exodeoxyribonuclease VII small subunit
MPKATTSVTAATAVAPAYEEAMAELEALVERMESGGLPLDQLLSGYQRGAELLQVCRQRLQAVEEQIKVLDQGTIKPWKGA